MWIKEPNYPLGKSLNDRVNFLYQNKNIYIMDNHLAAGWAWLKHIDITKKHNLFHIDKHYDLLDFPKTIPSEIIDKGIKLHELSFDQYLDLEQPLNGKSAPLFRWDNYIGNLELAYSGLFELTYFATHQEGNKKDNFIDLEIEFQHLIDNLDYWIESNNQHSWIVNLDLDYFYGDFNGKRMKIFTDHFIQEFAVTVKKITTKIDVLTICLSPEVCGGWDKALHINNYFCEALNLDFELNSNS